jgi:hypothetical protein
MSFCLVVKRLRCVGIAALLAFALPTVGWAQQFGAPSCAAPEGPACGSCCQTHHCPPAFNYCYERPPCIHWHCGCPHPICNPCDLPHFGYYEPCWSPWPFPANLAHCPTPPPASFVNLAPYVNPNQPGPRPPGMLPPSNIAPVPGAPPMMPPISNGGPDELQTPRRYETPR